VNVTSGADTGSSAGARSVANDSLYIPAGRIQNVQQVLNRETHQLVIG